MAESKRYAIRVPDDELEAWKSAAEGAGLTVSEWVRRCCRIGSPPPARPTAAEVKERIDSRPPDDEPCLHPKAKQKKLAYGTFCENCGEKIR